MKNADNILDDHSITMPDTPDNLNRPQQPPGGRMIDVNYHVLTESGQPPPRDYYESFTALGGIGELDRDFAIRIAACAGLRNRIAHEYEAIDPARVHEALQSAVRDIPVYLRRVSDYAGL